MQYTNNSQYQQQPKTTVLRLRRTRKPKQIFSWNGFERERQTLIEAATRLRQFSENCGYSDCQFFTACATSYRNNSQNPNNDIAGECLRIIHDLQRNLVHNHNLNWNFVYSEWSNILNPNEFQKNLTNNLVVKDYIKNN